MSTQGNRWTGPVVGALVASSAALVLAGRGTGGGGAPVAAQAQEVQQATARGITVVGDGTARAQPDVVTVRLGVELTAQTPAEALSRTREAADRIVQRLRQGGVAEADVQTGNLNVFPIQAPTPQGPPDPTRISGYRGTASVVAQVQDITQVGALLDGALQAGATAVQGLSFGIKDDGALRRQAIQAAIAAARPEADAAASAAGLTITGVRAVVEQSFGAPVPLDAGGLGGGAAPEGIALGQLSVTTRVSVTYDVAP